MSHEIFEDLLIDAQSRTLSATEQKQLAEHLAQGCASCSELKESLEIVSAKLSLAVPSEPLPPTLKEKVFAEIRANAIDQPSARSWRSWGLALAAIALMGVLVPRFFSQPAVIGQLEQLQGDIFINQEHATEKQPLRAGQYISTSENATAELKLSDRARLKIKPGSSLYVKKKVDGYDVYLEKGGVMNLVKTGTAYAVITPALKAEARGTYFFVKVKNPQQTYVCICSGHIVVSQKTFREDLQSDHHKALMVTDTPDGIKSEPSTLVDHGDGAELAALLLRFQ